MLDAFLPDEPVTWSDKSGREVTFYPFLVITEGKGERVAWLPYWHVVRGKDVEQKKYGQWAPSMDLSTFEELVPKPDRRATSSRPRLGYETAQIL